LGGVSSRRQTLDEFLNRARETVYLCLGLQLRLCERGDGRRQRLVKLALRLCLHLYDAAEFGYLRLRPGELRLRLGELRLRPGELRLHPLDAPFERGLMLQQELDGALHLFAGHFFAPFFTDFFEDGRPGFRHLGDCKLVAHGRER